jgi:hypothetical protein
VPHKFRLLKSRQFMRFSKCLLELTPCLSGDGGEVLTMVESFSMGFDGDSSEEIDQ